MNNKKKYLVLVLFFVLIGISVFSLTKNSKNDDEVGDEKGNENIVASEDKKQEFLLEGYPLDVVPLYKLAKISSNKFIVNIDSSILSNFDEKDYNYYNVVFESEASQSDFLEYYKGLFEREYVDKYPMENMVKGYLGKYKVSVAHYGSGNTGYIQVHLPSEEFKKENRYFEPFPIIFELDPMFLEGQNSYGLLNQSGGQVEYYKHFTVIDSGDNNKDGLDDINEFSVLIEKYQSLYKDKPEYSFNPDTSVMTWEENGLSVNINFKRDHGRIYLNIRGSMNS